MARQERLFGGVVVVVVVLLVVVALVFPVVVVVRMASVVANTGTTQLRKPDSYRSISTTCRDRSRTPRQR